MLMACASPIECNTIKESPCDIWYLDLGCSNHITGNLNLLTRLDKSFQVDITHANNIQAIVLGKGTIGILTKNGEQKTMHYVYFFKGLQHNLMSIEKLLQKNIESTRKTIIV